MLIDKCLGIFYDQSKVSASTSSRHFPSKHFGHCLEVSYRIRDIAGWLLLAIVAWINHPWEHSHLSFKGGSVGCCKGGKVFGHDGTPAGFGSGCKGLYLDWGDVLAFYHTAAGGSGIEGYHDEVLFEETEGHLVGGALYLLGPEVIVVIVSAQSWHTDADGVLGSGDVAVFSLGVVLETEHEAGKGLGVHLGETHRPDLLYHLTGAGAEAATVAHLKGGLQGDGDGPTGVVLADVGLVDPGTGDIQPCWNRAIGFWLLAVGGRWLLLAEGGFEGAGAAGLEAGMGCALELDVLDASFFAKLALGWAAAFGIDHEDVGLYDVEGGDKVDDSTTLIDIGFFHGLDVPYHEEAFFLGEHGLTMFVLEVGGIGPYAYIEVAKLGGLLEELYVSAVKQVVTTRYEDFFAHLFHNSFLEVLDKVGAYFGGYMVGCYLGHVVLYHDFYKLFE